MNKISVLECIEAISLGDISFNTLKNVVVDGDASSYDYICCHKGYAIFKIRIDGVPHIMKIYLKNDTDQLHKSFDRCNAFYSNIFIKMDILYDELNIFSYNKLHKHDVAIMLADFDKKIDNKYEYTRKFINLITNILNTNFIIDSFSLKWCVNNGNELKISLEKGGIVMPYKDIQVDMLMAFKNYLLSVLSYIRYNYNEDNFEKFVGDSPEFKISNYATYCSKDFIDVFTPRSGNKELNDTIHALLNNPCREDCAKTMKILSKDLEKLWSVSHDFIICKTALETLKDEYEIIDSEKENRITIRNKKTKKYGFIDDNCDIVIECLYDSVTVFEEGICVASIDSKFGAIDNYGEIIINFIYDDLEFCVNENLYITLQDDLNGLISRSEEIILEPIHSWIDKFHCSRARFQDYKTNKFGFLNPEGEIVIEAQWDEISTFEEGYANIFMNGRKFIIDIDGEKVN